MTVLVYRSSQSVFWCRGHTVYNLEDCRKIGLERISWGLVQSSFQRGSNQDSAIIKVQSSGCTVACKYYGNTWEIVRKKEVYLNRVLLLYLNVMITVCFCSYTDFTWYCHVQVISFLASPHVTGNRNIPRGKSHLFCWIRWWKGIHNICTGQKGGRRMQAGGQCHWKISFKNLSTYFLFSEISFGKGNSIFNHRNTVLLQVWKGTVAISTTPVERYHGWPNRPFPFKVFS